MASSKFAPVSPLDDARGYTSPAHVPDAWRADRPGDITGFQPEGGRLGYQGPDQGFALKIARGFRTRVTVAAGESVDDAIRGCLGIALRRASMFGRAPTVHDLTLAFTIWGFLDEHPPAELVALRHGVFEGVGNVVHHYDDARELVDMIPEATLRLTHQQAAVRYPDQWKDLVGA